MDLKNCIFEELLKAAQPKRGLFVIPLPILVLVRHIIHAC